ncbi:MAG: potassium channel family protein [Bacteroidota bacterium]|nr:potassium channel family protein [Bacteroidota bacterium]
MNRDFTSYSYKTFNNDFFYEETLISDKTTVVTFFNEEKKASTEVKLAFIDKENAKNIFDNKKNINLKNCFFEDFPQIYGDFLKLKISDCILINKSIITIDIEISGKTDLSGSFFISPEIDFSNSIFNSSVNFTNVLIQTDNFVFNEVTLSNGINFKNAIFTDGIKQFEKIDVTKGDVNFNNVDFNDGNISFQDSKLGEDRKTFIFSRFGIGFIDFTRTNFGGNLISFERTILGDGNITFRSANFGSGTVDFRRTEFGNGEKLFVHTDFGDGNVKFVNSIFKSGKISFRLADFGKGNVDFHFTHFGKTDLLFDRTKFHDGTFDFRGVDIEKGRVIFNHLEFGDGDFIFESFELKKGSFSIKNSVFGKGFFNFENALCSNINLNVENVDFGYGSVSFLNSKFKKITLKNTQINSYFDLRVKKAEKLDLANSVIKDVLDLNPTKEDLNINDIRLQGVRLLGRIYIDWKRSNVKNKILSQEVSFKEKSDQFRILKENYRNMGLYEFEDLAYVEFKRMESKEKLNQIEEKGFFTKIKKRLFHGFEVLIFDKMGKYATDPISVLFSMGIIYLIFSFLFLMLEYIFPKNAQILSSLFEPDSPEILGNAGKAFYHSAITFLTIGYGDYYPIGIIRFLSGVEGFIGLFMMSYFTVAFVRKILR